MHEFFSQIEPSHIGMEACGSAHYWARELKAMGHEGLLMPPAYTKPYVKRGKNDAVDADACCEAMSRARGHLLRTDRGRTYDRSRPNRSKRQKSACHAVHI
jgi:transposase